MPSTSAYALLSANVYGNSTLVRSVQNVLPLLDGWVALPNAPFGTLSTGSTETGFMARAYQNGNDIIVSYAGTTDEEGMEGLDWLNGNLPAASAAWLAPQVIEAAKFYLDVLATHPGTNITFTGHSLGGGLASLMAVYFDRHATVFDEAPFQKSADSVAVVNALKLVLWGQGYSVPTELLGYIPGDLSGAFVPSPTRLARQRNVDQVYVTGEALSLVGTAWTNLVSLGLGIVNPALWLLGTGVAKILGTEVPIDPMAKTMLGWQISIPGTETPVPGVSGEPTDLHSISLLAGMWTSQEFLETVQAHPELLARLFAGIYSNVPKRKEANLIDLLVQREYRGEGSLSVLSLDVDKIDLANGFSSLTRFANGTASPSAINVASVLDDVVLASLYNQGKGRVPAQRNLGQFQTVLHQVTGGLQVDLDLLGDEAPAVEQELKNLLDAVLGERSGATLGMSGSRWTIQTGTTSLQISETEDARADVVLGYDGTDSINGGGGHDLLVGYGGNDTLDGGDGFDDLFGGQGTDTYDFTGAFGGDSIIDSDGQGRIVVDGIAIDGANTRKIDDGAYTDGTWLYWVAPNGKGGADLTLQRDSSVNVITIRDWSPSRNLGITLNDVSVDRSTAVTISGDKDYGPNHDQRDAWGNPAGAATPGSDDTLTGSPGNDSIRGLGGRDQIRGQAGADVIEGGSGIDIVAAGAGDDRLYGADQIALAQAIFAGDTGSATALKGDWLNGGDGDDLVVTGGDNDALFGGHGRDILVGGAGDDVLDGDDDYTALGFDWAITDYGNPFDRLFTGVWIESAPAGASDELYGGAGNDELFGVLGDDRLFGGDGNDSLSGDDDDDELYGGDGNDFLTGDYGKLAYDSGYGLVIQGSDYLDGGAGDDWMQGESGDDELFGGAGNDWIWGDAVTYTGAVDGSDYLDGEDGNDQLVAGGGNDEVFGGAGNDTLTGDAGDDYLDGEDGDDALLGGAGNDELFGGAGSDSLWGDDGLAIGADYLDGEDGDDFLMGAGGDDSLVGGIGNDTLLGGDGADELSGDDGNDQLAGNGGDDFLEGGEGNDIIRGDEGDDVAYGDGGADVLYGLSGADMLQGGAGNDEVQGGDANDTLYGGGDDDLVVGQLGDDVADGGAGNDEVQGNEGNDTVNGGSGNDTVFGMVGNDVVSGDDGDDYVDGGDGNDVLYGAAGNDWMLGGYGNDTLDGGRGNDLMSAGSGADTYLFGRGSGNDVIENYDPAYSISDVLRFSADVRPADVRAHRTGDDLVLGIVDSGDSVTIRNHFVATSSRYDWYYGYTYYYGFQVGSIRFADGTSWSGNSIPLYYSSPTGSGVLYGSSDADFFAGATADSAFRSSNGNDTYSIGPRSGRVLVDDYGTSTDVDTLSLSSTAADVRMTRVDDNLLLRFRDSPDQIRVSGQFLTWGAGVERIEFQGDGTSWDRSTITQRLMTGTDQDDLLFGTYGADTISGLGGDDSIDASDGDDALDGGPGNDTLAGGFGSDAYLFGIGSGSDLIAGEGGNYSTLDAIVLKAGVLPADVALARDGEDLVMSIVGASDLLRVSGYFHDPGNGAVGSIEQVRFDDGTVWDASVIRSKLPLPTNGADLIYGYETNDSLAGLGGDDTLYGGRGEDTLDGGLGNDLLVGGPGSNTFLFDAGSGMDTINAFDSYGGWYGTVKLGPDISPQSVVASRKGNDLLLFQPGSPDQLTVLQMFGPYANVNAIVFDDGTVWDQSTISSFATSGLLRGTERDDALVGTGNYEPMYGFAGDDTLDGGAGNDTLTGGAGNDTYIVDSGLDVVVENAGEGADIVLSYSSYTLPGNVENLTMIGGFASVGTGNALDNRLVGNATNDALNGAAGNDTLDGGAGGDTLSGGLGNDVYLVDNPFDVTTEQANEGLDSVLSWVTYVLAANVENLTLTGTAAIDGTGNAMANALTGNAANNLLDGSAGADTLQGGAGDDTYVVENVGDVIVEAANEGSDSVNSSITYTLATNVENLTLTGTAALNATGNALGNVLTGNSANNVLTGLGGDDTYIVTSGDTVVEYANAGIDTVSAGFAYTLGANLENLTLTGTSRLTGTGNALNNSLTGNSAANSLSAGAGDDTLDGGLGTDTLIGGTGNDYYVVDVKADTITENVNEGTDTVRAAFSYTLGTNLENLVLAAGAALDGTGNAANNVITGNGSNNVLNGAAGADTLIGGAGDDTYIVDNSGDVITERVGEGVDTVQSSLSYALAANVENLVLTGTSAANATGNALNNMLTGNSAANVLAGGAGDDTYVVGAGDTVTEIAGEGVDTVQSSVTHVLGANVENLTLTGTSAINGTGNGLDNVLAGNSAANVLTGGAGNDTYVIGSGDTVSEAANEGVDTVTSSITFTLGANLENLTLTGTSAINGTGNALDNVIVGNSAANVLTGGAGNDTYVVGAGDTVVEGVNAGIDSVQSAATFTLSANVENLTLTGSAAINGTGNASDNVLVGNGASNVLDGGAGQDYLAGGAGDDIYLIDVAGDVVFENAGEGTDTVQSTVSFIAGIDIENVTLLGTAAINATGNAGNNTLTGNGAGNLLTGGAGNDTLVGGGGADSLIGGTGADTYVVAAPGSTIVENAGDGIDTVQAGVAFVLGDNLENLTLTGSANISGTGNALVNVIVGNAGSNALAGGGGADTLYGGEGNDTLVGSLGATLYGGMGDDVYVMTGMSGYLSDYRDSFETNGGGIDTVETNSFVWLEEYAYYDNSSGYHWLGSVENAAITGSGNGTLRGNDLNNVLRGNVGDDNLRGLNGNDSLYGNTGHDTLNGDDGDDLLDGGDGNDFLDGGTGNDTLSGGAGNDMLFGGAGTNTCAGGTGDDYYNPSSGSTTIVENPGEGTDTVQDGFGTYTLAANVENLFITQGIQLATATGNSLNNLLTGNEYANTLNGVAGDDTLVGGAGLDTLVGGTGNDTYVVDDVGDTITENLNEGNDTVQSSFACTLGANLENLTLIGSLAIAGTGNALDNVIAGNSAANVLAGGTGNDTYVVDALDTLVENVGEGTDTVRASFSYTLGVNFENLTLTGTAALSGTGNIVANVLVGNSGNNVLDGGAGADTLKGGLGNDVYVIDNSADAVVENASEGIDTVQSSVTCALAANVENLTLTGAQAINGSGNALANVIAGNAAANVLSGGLGDDTYVIVDTLDTLVENANEGIDSVQSAVTYTLGTNLENLVLTGSASINAYGNALANTLSGNWGANVLAGGSGDDTYIVDDYADSIVESANEGTDTINAAIDYSLSANVENLVLTGYAYRGTGNALANIITGNLYANLLDGGAGGDTMIGGKGDDSYVVDNAGDVVSEGAGEGTDMVQSSVTCSLAANVENLALTGSAAINGFGNALNNTLTGNVAINALAGGAGDDTYVIGAGDVVTESSNEGVDTVQVDLSYALGVNVENLVLTGSAGINGTGNSLDNVLSGNSAANVLTGGAGNDTYVVGAGDIVVELGGQGIDTICTDVSWILGTNFENLTLLDSGGSINGTGNALDNVLTGNVYANVLTGGAGNDTYVVGAGDTVLENAGEGVDTVMTSVTAVLANNVENIVLTGASAIGATGNNLDNLMTGNAASNTLDGQSGADRMAGGAGDDTYWVDSTGDVVTESANEGIDTVQSFIDYELGADVENLSLNSVQSIRGTGNALNNLVNGTTADNVLIGLAGDDTLDGRFGADTMTGGIGNDTYAVDSLGDMVVENAGEGTDDVLSRIDYTLGANLENLTLLGMAAVYGTGTAGNNTLAGSVADNVLDGGAGADAMSGGKGNDTYLVDDIGDTVSENASEGTDLVISSVSFTLGTEVENLTLIGTAAIGGTGNAGDNRLFGNSAANTLSGGSGANYIDGGAGADFLSAGSGDDIYVVDDVGDVIQDSGGYDTVMTSVGFALSSGLENLTLTGADAIDGSGNGYSNILVGNAAANVLDGGASGDVMLGGAGDDTYIVDDATDWVGEYLGEGVDSVRSSVNWTLGVNIENLVLTGSAAIDGTDNALDNMLVGNAADNRLSAGRGNDTLIGGGGKDTLTASAGNNVLIGGSGNDNLRAGSGADTIAFNRGDGADVLVAAGGGAGTLSIGGGISYADMRFDTSGSDLLFTLGGSDQIVLKDWYAGAGQRTVDKLQVIAQAMAGFDADGSDPLLDDNVEQFDLAGLAARFDAARAADPSVSSWALSGSLSELHTAGSDTAAFGGDVVLQYGVAGQVPVVGGTSTVSPVAALSTFDGASLAASGSDRLTMESADVQPADGVAAVAGAAQGGGESTGFLTGWRLDPSMSASSAEAVGRPGTNADGPARPSIDEAVHGMPRAPDGGVTRGSARTSSSPLGQSGTSSAVEAAGTAQAADSTGSRAQASGLPAVEPAASSATNAADALNARIGRVLDHWLQATDNASPGIRLSHYDQVLSGDLDAADRSNRDEVGRLSYSARWQRLRFMLDRQGNSFGEGHSAEAGSQFLPAAGMASSFDDATDLASKALARGAPGRAPLPMFSGLQDGFSRL